ncbi:fibronectin type III-like domain-contianing protein [Kitasatospora aburaviensis]
MVRPGRGGAAVPLRPRPLVHLLRLQRPHRDRAGRRRAGPGRLRRRQPRHSDGHRGAPAVRRLPVGGGRAPQQLKAFGKLTLAPGRSQHVTLRLDRSSFATWDAQVHGWGCPAGGTASRSGRPPGHHG